MFGKKRGEGSEQNSDQRWNILTRARWSNVTNPSLSPLSKKRNYLRARETKRGKGKKRKKKGGIVRHMTQYNERCWSVLTNDKETVGERCAHVRISSNSAEGLPLSRACKLCVRRMVKIRERIGWSKGFFSVNFHTEGGPPARTPDRSIKFQRRNGNTWTYFTLLKSCLIRRKSGWEKPLSMLSINWNSIGPPIVLSSLSKIASWILRIWCCNFLFFLLFFWERRERNKDRFKRTWENFKRLPRGCTTYGLIILYEAGISFFGRKRRKCEEIL